MTQNSGRGSDPAELFEQGARLLGMAVRTFGAQAGREVKSEWAQAADELRMAFTKRPRAAAADSESLKFDLAVGIAQRGVDALERIADALEAKKKNKPRRDDDPVHPQD